MRKLFTYQLIFILFLSCIENNKQGSFNDKKDIVIKDCHVHIMSPELINEWKSLGIPFSRPEYYYSNLDTILKKNKAEFIHLIGMGYVYGSPDFYQGNDEYEQIKRENDFLFNTSENFQNKVIPYFTVDPLKDYAKSEITRCLSKNRNTGLKLHFNTSQVYLTEPEHLQKIKVIFEMASNNKLPVLLHFDNWHPKFGEEDVEILVDSILTKIKPIQLTIAHFGTSGGFNQKTKNVVDAFVELYDKSKIPQQHKIYFDISGVALDKNSEGVDKLSEEEFIELKSYCDKLGYEKIIFGTDYPLYTTEEYINILKEKVGLTDSEIRTIINKKVATNNSNK